MTMYRHPERRIIIHEDLSNLQLIARIDPPIPYGNTDQGQRTTGLLAAGDG